MDILSKFQTPLTGSIKEFYLYVAKAGTDGIYNLLNLFGIYGKYDCTVGIGGTYDYTDPSEAINAGKTNLKIMTDVKWEQDVTIGNKIINIVGNYDYKIAIEQENNISRCYLNVSNIDFVISGTKKTFYGSDVIINLKKCKITGNSDYNIFLSDSSTSQNTCFIYADKLDITAGSGNLEIKNIRDVDELNIDIDNSNCDIKILNGNIKRITTTGNSTSNYLFKAYASTIDFIKNEVVGTVYMQLYQFTSINKGSSTTNLVIEVEEEDVYINNFNTIRQLSIHADNLSLNNCKIYNLATTVAHAISYLFREFNNIELTRDAELTISANNQILTNLKVYKSIKIDGDNITLINPILENDTIIISASADKTVITNPRTNSTIPYGGTGTLITNANTI